MPGAIVMVPSGFKVNTGFTAVVVKITSVGLIGGIPLKVSFPNTEPVVAPGRPPVVSAFATIAFNTTIVAVAVSQLTGFAPTSHI